MALDPQAFHDAFWEGVENAPSYGNYLTSPGSQQIRANSMYNQAQVANAMAYISPTQWTDAQFEPVVPRNRTSIIAAVGFGGWR